MNTIDTTQKKKIHIPDNMRLIVAIDLYSTPYNFVLSQLVTGTGKSCSRTILYAVQNYYTAIIDMFSSMSPRYRRG